MPAPSWGRITSYNVCYTKLLRRVLVLFANGSIPVLIATDVAARGLDIKELAAVVNYELPHDPEVYIHRIGRTGRAGNEGLALSLFLPAEVSRVNAIEELLDRNNFV